jgi:hypothetical protein
VCCVEADGSLDIIDHVPHVHRGHRSSPEALFLRLLGPEVDIANRRFATAERIGES